MVDNPRRPNKPQLGRNPITDIHLRPLSGWELTGAVKPGVEGPGCPVGCIYCNQISMDKGDTGDRLAPYASFMVDGGISLNTRLMVGPKVERRIGVKQLITELGTNPFYNSDSPIFLENFNDPGLDWGETSDLIETAIRDLHHEGSFVFITKMGIKPPQVDRLVQLQQELGAKIIGIVTYSGMPKGIEKSGDTIRLGTLRKLHEAGIPTILSIRPLIEGINDSEDNITRVLEETRGIADAVISGGLFVFDKVTESNFSAAGFPLPDVYTQDVYSLAKAVPKDYKPIVRRLAKKMGHPAAIHNHTTCAVTDLTTRAYGVSRPDRYPHWFHHNAPVFSDCGDCSKQQSSTCHEAYSQPFDTVAAKAKTALAHIGYPSFGVVESLRVPKLLMVVGGALTYEELAAIREKSGWYVDNLPDREGFMYRAVPAIEDDLTYGDRKFKYEEVIAKEFLVGQEWNVILRSTDTKLNSTTLRWLRSRVRNRVQGITIDDIQKNGPDHYVDMLSSQPGNELSRDALKDILQSVI